MARNNTTARIHFKIVFSILKSFWMQDPRNEHECFNKVQKQMSPDDEVNGDENSSLLKLLFRLLCQG